MIQKQDKTSEGVRGILFGGKMSVSERNQGLWGMFPSLSLRGEWTVILKGWEGRGPENQRKGDFFPNFYCHLDLTSDKVKGAGKIYRKSGFLRFLRNSKGLTLYCGSKHFNFSFHY